ncbi:MAG: DEAD/DEAH box helicase family protein, partial [Pseudomonadales bacterium]|nr:DEAD/DEAH box helicase family protein [Pseudomonadales bacterium]
MSHHIVHVAVPVPLRQIFDYLAPVAALATLQPGVRVRVSFGRRSLIGIVIDVHNLPTPPLGHLKLIEEVLDIEPALTPTLFKLAQFASNYYCHPIGEVLAQALPVALRQGDPVAAEPDLRWRPTSLGRLLALETQQRAPRQMAALTLLRDEPQGISREFAQVWGVTTRDLGALVKRGWAETYVHEEPHELPSAQLAQPPLPASQEQQLAIDRVLSSTGFQTFLLEGITGSGKTEVYLQIIAEVLKRGQQALVLVPEISLTPQTVARFQHRFRCPVVSLHSGLSDKERLKAWRRAR